MNRGPQRRTALLSDKAFEAIRDMILAGELAPGELLSKREVAKRLRMSKTPVDAAVERLSAEGFVVVSPRQGVTIREPSPRDLADLFDLRLAIEPHVMRRLAGSVTPAQAEEMLANTEAQAKAAADGDVPRSARLDTEFHMMPCQFLESGEIDRVMRNLMGRLQHTMAWVVRRHPGRMAASPQEHASIARALVAGNGERAAERMVSHLNAARQQLSA